MNDLNKIKGINSRQIKLLTEAGINSATSLAMSNIFKIADIDGIGDKSARKLIWNARSALGMTSFKTANNIAENEESITTGSKQLNKILGGGVQTGRLTEVYGPFKSGKTLLASTISVTTQLPKDRGGLASPVIYIDTENTFSKEKIKRIARRFGLNPNTVLSNIYHAKIYSSDHQVQMIEQAESLCKEKEARLIIVDSLMALLRYEYLGIGMLAKRQGLLNRILHALSRIAETYNCAVLLTNQVGTKMLGSFSTNDAIGGNIVAHGCHFRMEFKTKGFSSNQSLARRARIVDAPDLPPDEAEFFITASGIADTEKVDLPNEKDAELDLERLEDVDGEVQGTPVDFIKGIGQGMKDNLNRAGIDSIEQLLDHDPDILSEEINTSVEKIAKWRELGQVLIESVT